MGVLKLWIVQRNDDRAYYDDYLGFVCAAETEDEARNMHPSGDDANWEEREVFSRGKTYFVFTHWVDRGNAGKLSVRMIGIAAHNLQPGVLFTETQGD